ncbi:permease family-domain-containing protein [Dichotomocladium elegans]|nr:permease family-domain-containing protein [Dichotomocladium elegans]
MVWAGFTDKLNNAVAGSRIGRYFQLEGSGAYRERKGTRFTTEIRAGITTFFAMAYIISVNASIISDSGGTCVCEGTADDLTCDLNEEYMACVFRVKNDMIIATAIMSMIASILVGVMANLPLGLAPGMGLNAYFTYNVVGYHGSGAISYETALAAVLIEGIIFLFLSIFGIRQWLARIIPMSIKVAMGCGIGLYLCFIGLQSSAGIGLVTLNSSTLVSLGACPAAYKDSTGACKGHTMESPTTWMGILGLIVIVILTMYRVRGAILLGIIFVSITSWPRVSQVTYFPYTTMGQAGFDYFKQVVTLHNIDSVVGKFSFDLSSREIWIALITFLYVDIMDTTGTMYSMARYGGFTDKAGDFEHSTNAFCADATSIIVGACLGSSPCTAYVESGAGIAEGGRTGITAITVGFGFFVSIFFSPIFASFPPWATGPALIVVGAMMTTSIRNINWDYPGDAIPAFITVTVMPFTYSIAYGVIGGCVSYIIINGIVWLLDIGTRGRIRPDYSLRENWWSAAFSRSFVPHWIRYLHGKVVGKPIPWHDDEFDYGSDYDKEESTSHPDVIVNSSSLHDGNTDIASLNHSSCPEKHEVY